MRVDLSLAALERLMGGDTEVEACLRQQVAEQFAKHHLKPLLNDALFSRMKQWFAGEVQKATEEAIGTLKREYSSVWGGQDKLTINESLKKAIEQMAVAAADAAIKANLEWYKRECIARDTAHIEKVITRALDQDIEKRVQAEVERRLTLAREMK